MPMNSIIGKKPEGLKRTTILKSTINNSKN
jgi:hypothetical protein